ncbi:hypothetical protein TWF225_008677 [Orbilia oligospora]|uniref:Protein kinase domain-containing protein n=1 Tax=Orbilia oligospora TaxID=2813651 RepID=A0A7C8KAB8_ORBOL|nr:hypothetical protein TWF751_008955 [Orbilia oligospora]KAF3176620.1 hypothetical protein TWF225_008677 [Orbilia oligospora]KAF3252713.1 hypothetical protein TWF128_006623 [Orbilia oligospora]TGJ73398.1 hypothetical protein EYR41_000496 [Orbilia oligospora]
MQAKSRNERQTQKTKLAESYNELLTEFSSPELRHVGNYTLGRLIGKGSFGNVYLATHKLTNGSKVVLKSAQKNDPNLAREIHHHRQLIHPHIVRLYEVVVTESLVWMVLEYCPGAELYDYLIKNGRLSTETAQKIFAQLVGAVAYVHQKNCVHRDLKLENIMLDRHENVKLCDFGFTREYERLRPLQTFCGTVCYSAPEMVKGEKYLGQAVDVWSLGVILYALLCGELPFDEDDETSTKLKILNEEPKYPEHLDADAVALIKSLLSKRPISRPTLLEILVHPFLVHYGNQQKNILAMQQPALFSTRIEKETLDRMKSAGVQTEVVVESVLAQKCDSLAGWWNLLIEKELRKEKRRQKRRSESRRVSAGSMLAAAAAADFLKPPREEAEAEWANISVKASSASLPAGPTQQPPNPNPKDRHPYNKLQRNPSNQSQIQIMSSPDLNRDPTFPSSASTRRPNQRKIHFLTTLAALKHWLFHSTRRASTASDAKYQPRLQNGSTSQSNLNQGRGLHSSHQSGSVRTRAGNVLEMLRENDRQRDARSRGRDTARQGGSSSHVPPSLVTAQQRKRQSISPSPLTPHSARRMSGRGLGGRKSTSSSLSSVRSFHKSHSKASSIASSSSVNSVQLASPRSPRASGVKVVATTPRTNSFPSNVRLVRQGTGVDAFNETAVFNKESVAFARRKKTAFKGPNLNLSHARNSSPSVAQGRRRHSASKRASTSSAGAQADAIQEEDEDECEIEEVAEFSPIIGEHEEVVFIKEEGSDVGNTDGDCRDDVSLNRIRSDRSDVPDVEEPRGRKLEKQPA